MVRLVLGCILLALLPTTCWADGGQLRLLATTGGCRIAVFTSPTPPRVGTLDVSVLVTEEATGRWLGEVSIEVKLRSPRGVIVQGVAEQGAATNRLLRAALLEVTEAGEWQVEVNVAGPQGPATVSFPLFVDQPLPRWHQLWPWFCWPIVPIVLFLWHQQRLARLQRHSGLTASPPPSASL